MLRYALRRAYFGLIGMLLFTLPLFAAMRFQMHDQIRCEWFQYDCYNPSQLLLLRNGPFYAVWQTGMPPHDHWPIALVLLAGGAALQVALSGRHAATD